MRISRGTPLICFANRSSEVPNPRNCMSAKCKSKSCIKQNKKYLIYQQWSFKFSEIGENWGFFSFFSDFGGESLFLSHKWGLVC